MSFLSSLPDPSTFRILLSTDNHLGYAEKDGVRGDDSFRTFEEILSLAHSHHVDLVLLGGDVFHENRPSRMSMYRCMDILNKYVLGDRPITFDVLSDERVNFPERGKVNFRDENINIGLPIFSIHGNHDDPAGMGGKSPMHILSASKMVNYFGNALDPNNIEITPVCLKKGDTKLALYGLGALKDERLHRTLRAGNVAFLRPAEDQDNWFNLFVLHQNRVEHSSIYKNVIPETSLPDFLDVVFWGHEHECLMELKRSPGGFFVLQPGSSVVTSLVAAEAKQKSVGIFEINNKNCRLIPIPLQTIRPFVIREVVLAEVDDLQDSLQNTDAIDHYLGQIVNEMILEANDPIKFPAPEKLCLDPNSHLPLIRLRVLSSFLILRK